MPKSNEIAGGSPTRAVVITAALARTVTIDQIGGIETKAALERELAHGPTFAGMADEDLARLLQELELELHVRGWRPQRNWRRATDEERAGVQGPPA